MRPNNYKICIQNQAQVIYQGHGAGKPRSFKTGMRLAARTFPCVFRRRGVARLNFHSSFILCSMFVLGGVA